MTDDGPRDCDLVVEHAVLLTLDERRSIYRDGAVAIDGSRIAAVGTTAEIRVAWRGRRVIDATDHVALPGLVNGHLHMSQQLFRGVVPDDLPVDRYLAEWSFPYYRALTEEEEATAVALACADALRTGTTLVVEAGTMRFPEACAEAIERVGARAVIGRWAMDLEPDWPELGGLPTDEALAAVEQLLHTVGTDPRRRVSAFASVIGMGTCTDELIVGAKALADRYGTTLNMHQSYSREEIERYRAQAGFAGDPLLHLEDIGALDRNVRLVHLVHTEANAITRLAARGTSVAHCDMVMKLALGITTHSRVPEMIEAGVNVCVGTDTVNCANTSDVLRCAHTTALVYRDARGRLDILPAETTLEMCTLAGARSVGAGDALGSLEPGKEADVVLFDADRPEWIPNVDPVSNLVYSADGGSVDTVIVGGEVVLEHGRLTRVDEHALYAHARTLSASILERLELAAGPRWPVIG
jgi:cytosine/adenosine deaminase-related metal-dependent hydrolase